MELNRKIFMGIVEDNKDPNRKGRIKVRVQTLYHCLAVEDIPYASPFAGLAGKKFEIPAIGKIVNVLFLNDDLYSPLYIYSENYNINLQNKLNNLTDEEYVDFISLLFDEKTQIYVKGQELTIDMLLNKITITNTNKNAINIELKDNKQILNLGTRDSTQDAVLGTNFFEWMDKFIDELSNPTCLIGNVGGWPTPILRPFLDMLCMEYKMKRPTFVSNNVKIVDNGKVNILKRTPDTNNKKHDIDLIIPEDECSEFEKVPGAGTIQEKIENQNKKACEELENAAATDEVPYREHPSENSNLELTSEETKKVWSTDAQNQINQLHPEFRPYVIKFLNACEAKNILVNITSGYRSIEKQKELQSTGNAAKPGYSYHNYGLAIDISLKNSNDWNTVGEIGEAIGLRWGIHFKNPKPERWHFDGAYIFGSSTAELKKKYDNGQLSNGYVNLGGDQAAYAENKFKDQPYSKPTKEDCDNAKFNRKEAKKVKKNTNNQSDEKEQAPSTELGNEKISKPFDCEETDLSTSTKLEPNKKLSKEDFVKLLYPYALESERKTGVPALATLSQAAWESGWGKSSPGNMYFGIKAQTNYTGQKQLITTTEILKNPNITYPEIISITPVTINGNQYYKYKVKDYFRKYNTPEESFTDHGKFFIENNRYKNAMLVKNDPYAFIDEVSKAGYATDPNYASNLKSITRDMENILGRLCV